MHGWLAVEGAALASLRDDLSGIVRKKDGESRSISAGLVKADSAYSDQASRLVECCRALLAMRATGGLVALFDAGLRAGQTFARASADAKRAQGVVDFDDLIAHAQPLLPPHGMGTWVRHQLTQPTHNT